MFELSLSIVVYCAVWLGLAYGWVRWRGNADLVVPLVLWPVVIPLLLVCLGVGTLMDHALKAHRKARNRAGCSNR